MIEKKKEEGGKTK